MTSTQKKFSTPTPWFTAPWWNELYEKQVFPFLASRILPMPSLDLRDSPSSHRPAVPPARTSQRVRAATASRPSPASLSPCSPLGRVAVRVVAAAIVAAGVAALLVLIRGFLAAYRVASQGKL
jgi:hypothetical protein